MKEKDKIKTICHFCGRDITKNVNINENYVFCDICKLFSVKGNLNSKKSRKKIK